MAVAGPRRGVRADPERMATVGIVTGAGRGTGFVFARRMVDLVDVLVVVAQDR